MITPRPFFLAKVMVRKVGDIGGEETDLPSGVARLCGWRDEVSTYDCVAAIREGCQPMCVQAYLM